MKRYVGSRGPHDELIVTVDGRELAARQDLWDHSPTGFECGYAGSGPAQLALAILVDHFEGEHAAEERAIQLHQRFKFALVVDLERTWEIDSHAIDQALKAIGG